MDEPTTTEEQKTEQFSPRSAQLCLEDILNAIPKNKKMSIFGAANELAIVLTHLSVGRNPRTSVLPPT